MNKCRGRMAPSESVILLMFMCSKPVGLTGELIIDKKYRDKQHWENSPVLWVKLTC